MKLQCFSEIGECFFFGRSLARDIDLQALRDEPIPFAPNCRSERSLHDVIVPPAKGVLRKPVMILYTLSNRRPSRPAPWDTYTKGL